MTEEQTEYIHKLCDDYNQEIEMLNEREVSLKNALSEVEKRKEFLYENIVHNVGNFVGDILEKQEQEFYQKLKDNGFPTNKIFVTFIKSISKTIIFFEKIFKKEAKSAPAL